MRSAPRRGRNIGAGTITCNYDGANKHRTVIEDGAFIGSNSALVAPVTIGQDATIGAGSTIGQDAPAGELTVSRMPSNHDSRLDPAEEDFELHRLVSARLLASSQRLLDRPAGPVYFFRP